MCPGGKKLSIEDCQPYTKPQLNNICEADVCNEIQMLKDDGSCKDCPSFTKVSSDGR